VIGAQCRRERAAAVGGREQHARASLHVAGHRRAIVAGAAVVAAVDLHVR
jgi:hypothetical protein